MTADLVRLHDLHVRLGDVAVGRLQQLRHVVAFELFE